MATEKIFLPILILLLLILRSGGINSQIKYNQTSNDFLDTNLNYKFNTSVNIKDAIDFATQLLEGEIINAERKFKKETPVWEITLITLQRGIVEFEISGTDKSLIRLDAGEGPFDYEISPDPNFVPLSFAKQTAEKLTGQKTLKWKFLKNKNNWEYNFWLFTKSGKAEVRVDAESGEVITKKKKR